mgnify:CR=1 FL=1
MFRNERELARYIATNIRSDPYLSVKNILSENDISKSEFEEILVKYFDVQAPRFIAKPDIIMVAEDPKKLIDEWLLITIELKYFRNVKESKKFEKDLRKAFREIGQPLRYYLYGFDSSILWHIFEEDTNPETIKSYSNLLEEVIKKFKLPILLFTTKIIENNNFLVFKPIEIRSPNDLKYITGWMLNYCRDNIRNPLLPFDKDIIERRRAIKTVLKIP